MSEDFDCLASNCGDCLIDPIRAGVNPHPHEVSVLQSRYGHLPTDLHVLDRVIKNNARTIAYKLLRYLQTCVTFAGMAIPIIAPGNCPLSNTPVRSKACQYASRSRQHDSPRDAAHCVSRRPRGRPSCFVLLSRRIAKTARIRCIAGNPLSTVTCR